METNEHELQILEESKRIYEAWVSDVHRALTEPLTFDDSGKIATGVYWMPPVPPMYQTLLPTPAPPTRKRVTFRDRLKAWSSTIASKHYNYEG